MLTRIDNRLNSNQQTLVCPDSDNVVSGVHTLFSQNSKLIVTIGPVVNQATFWRVANTVNPLASRTRNVVERITLNFEMIEAGNAIVQGQDLGSFSCAEWIARTAETIDTKVVLFGITAFNLQIGAQPKLKNGFVELYALSNQANHSTGDGVLDGLIFWEYA